MAAADYKEDQDPTKFKSEKTGRGPLINSNWKNEVGFDLDINMYYILSLVVLEIVLEHSMME